MTRIILSVFCMLNVLIAEPPEGFKSLFDGKTFEGWTAHARIPVPKYPGASFKGFSEKQLKELKKNVGEWNIVDGAIVGGQYPTGSGKGAYLVSDEKFGDFELMMDIKPDWRTDTGFLVRTRDDGCIGYQVLVDHRPLGGIGGFYGNGLARIHAMPFAIDAVYDDSGNPIGLREADLKGKWAEIKDKTTAALSYKADVKDFLKVWKFGEYNTIKVRCEGRVPTLTTWVNGLKISVFDTSKLKWENFDPEACVELLGERGHISLEVHNSPPTGMGNDRWFPGAVVRWKNIYIKELPVGKLTSVVEKK